MQQIFYYLNRGLVKGGNQLDRIYYMIIILLICGLNKANYTHTYLNQITFVCSKIVRMRICIARAKNFQFETNESYANVYKELYDMQHIFRHIFSINKIIVFLLILFCYALKT